MKKSRKLEKQEDSYRRLKITLEQNAFNIGKSKNTRENICSTLTAMGRELKKHDKDN